MAVFDKAGEVSRFDVADMHDQVAERTARLAERAPCREATCTVVAVASGAGRAAPLRGARRARGGRRRDDEPLHLRAARGRARGGRRGGARAAEQPERDPGRRARRRAVRQAGARGAHHRAAGGARRPAGVRPDHAAPTRTPRPWGAPPTPCAWAVWPRPRATTPAAASPPARRWATRAASWWPGAIPSARSRPPSSGSPAAASCVTCLAGAGAPLDREWVEAHVPDGVEVEYHEGGQPAWWWLLCAE